MVHTSADVRGDELTVLRRPNIGYDFGSWAVAMHRHEELLGADKVLVVNDSLVGPFASLRDVIADFEETTADVWGMVQSLQVRPHLQSYFRGFRYGVLQEPAMRRFWRDIRVVPDKLQLIAAYEYGFTDHVHRNGFSSAAYVHAGDVVWGQLNPTIQGWRRLLEAGIPFIKRELLRRPELVPDGASIRPILAECFGIDVDEWW
jgi:lipopolysaccharide biosynthesis protein